VSSITYGGYGGRVRTPNSVWRGWDRFDYIMVAAALALVTYGCS